MTIIIGLVGLGLFLLPPLSLFANEASVGNGGGAWVCRDWNGGVEVIRWSVLVDLYEGREEFDLTIPEESGEWREIVEAKRQRLLSAGSLFYDVLIPYIDQVLATIKFVNADLEIVDDGLFRIRPSAARECPGGMVDYRQIANHTYYGKILIQRQHWEEPTFSNTSRAALIFHEAIYKYLREERGEKNSVLTRELVGDIFSDIPLNELVAELSRILGVSSDVCGISGSVEERILKCNLTKVTKDGTPWSLVTHTPEGVKVWKDFYAGMIWSDRLDQEMNHTRALKVCREDEEELSLKARGNITNVTWQLPSIDDYKLAEQHGIREILPNIAGHCFWSSSEYSDDRDRVWEFNGVSGEVFAGYRGLDGSVRCAGR